MRERETNTSSNLIIGVGYKKFFCNLCGSTISLDECAYSNISHDPRLPSTPSIDPCASCKFLQRKTSSQPSVAHTGSNISAESHPTNCLYCISEAGESFTSDCSKCISDIARVYDPRVSCKRYGESTKPSKSDRDFAQRRFSNPPFEDLDFILVGLGEKGKNCGVKRK